MKRTILVGLFPLLFIFLSGSLVYAERRDAGGKDSGVAPGRRQGWYCPWCGRLEGPGAAQPDGMWMNRGWKMGPGRSPASEARNLDRKRVTDRPTQPPAARKPNPPITLEQAKSFLERYLRSVDNPNLKLGKVTEEKDRYLAEVTTKDGSLVDKVEVDKRTGGMRSAY